MHYVCEFDCLCGECLGTCVCLSAVCMRVFVLPGCVWHCQAIWSAVWGAHYPLSSTVGSGALSICPASLSFALSLNLSFVLCFIFFNFLLQLGFISLTLLHCSTLGALSHLKNNPLPPKKSSLGICLFISVCLYVSVCEPE